MDSDSKSGKNSDFGEIYHEYAEEQYVQELLDLEAKVQAKLESKPPSKGVVFLFFAGAFLPLIFGVSPIIVFAMGIVSWILCIFSFQLRYANLFLLCVIASLVFHHVYKETRTSMKIVSFMGTH